MIKNPFEKWDIFFRFNRHELLIIKHYIRSITPEREHEDTIINFANQIETALKSIEN